LRVMMSTVHWAPGSCSCDSLTIGSCTALSNQARLTTLIVFSPNYKYNLSSYTFLKQLTL
jgi:hypothetical protein